VKGAAVLKLFVLACAATSGSLALCVGCHPQEGRDIAGARTELNPPKTEDFLKKVNAIQPGTRQDVVRRELGAPDETRQGVVQARPEPGPADNLIDLAPAGTRYEEWVYKRGDSHYHVFFTRGTRGGTVDWEVLTVKSTPKKAID
jgi:hypothetical protein